MAPPFDNSPRIRGRALQARRLRVWSADPTCTRCGRITRFPDGFELDHIVPLCKEGEDTDDNCQVLCTGLNGCHARKTADDIGYLFKATTGADGWPVE